MTEMLCSISGKRCKCGTPESCQESLRAKAIYFLERGLLNVERDMLKYVTTGEINSSKYPLPEFRQILRNIHRAIEQLEKL